MATFVLVHGGFHGGWCWKKVTPFLRSAGHEVYTPTLTGLGERIHLASPQVDLATHIQDVVNVLEYEDLRDVVLVGHSFGGIVISGVADGAAERLAHLVYVDAPVPQDGQSLWDLVGPAERQYLEAQVQATGDGWRLPHLRPVPWDVFVREDWGVTDEADMRWMAERLCPHPFRTLTEPVRLTNPAAATLARTYILCTARLAGGFRAQAVEEARRPNSGWRYREVGTRHDAMITMPRELADLLLEAVARNDLAAE